MGKEKQEYDIDIILSRLDRIEQKVLQIECVEHEWEDDGTNGYFGAYKVCEFLSVRCRKCGKGSWISGIEYAKQKKKEMEEKIKEYDAVIERNEGNNDKK